ncbi:hypothetical protein [Cetobacterium sp. ZOR0034]|uniref:hypothetical protein n=1 Tax=Cetobacterium sp. ZOR0034 TaxID=1339239 RepID=UPI0006456903|nr:hypothetical protein [Cetobacterium sp. ZOR0034]
MTSSSKAAIEIGSWTDIINLVIVCFTLIFNGVKNRTANKEDMEEKLRLFKLKTKASWFERVVLKKLEIYDKFFKKSRDIYFSIDKSNRKSKISARRMYQQKRDEIRDEMLPLKAFDQSLFDELDKIIEALENKLFSNEEVRKGELKEYQVFFTTVLINYEKDEYEVKNIIHLNS